MKTALYPPRPTKPNKHPAITDTKCRKFKKDGGKRTAGTVCVCTQVQEMPAFPDKCSSCIKHFTPPTISGAVLRMTTTKTHTYTPVNDWWTPSCEFKRKKMKKIPHYERLWRSFGVRWICCSAEETWCAQASDLSRFVPLLFFFFSHWCPRCVFSNDKQKRHKTNSHEKQRHQNELKQAPLCSDPGLEFCPHVPIWSLLLQSLNTQIQATFPQPHDWDSLGVTERKFASLHGCIRARLCVCVCVCLLGTILYGWVGRCSWFLLPGGGDPCRWAAGRLWMSHLCATI